MELQSADTFSFYQSNNYEISYIKYPVLTSKGIYLDGIRQDTFYVTHDNKFIFVKGGDKNDA